jgi:hypothetical protein
MKQILLAMSFLLTFSVNAQTFYKLDRAVVVKDQWSRPFSLKVKDTTIVIGDTANKIVRIAYSNNPVVSYKLQIKRDSTKYSISVTDSLIYDSMVYDQLFTGDSIQNSTDYKIALINASDIRAEYPIEAIYQSQPKKITTPKIATAFLDSVKKEKPIKINGNITAIGQYSDNRYLYQSIPQNYVRTYVNVNADVYGLPFSTGYYYSTESNGGLNKINNFRLSFNYNQFYSNIKDKLNKKVELNQTNQIKQFTSIDIGSLNTEVSKIQYELNSEDYKKKLGKYSSIVELGDVDTSFKKTYKYKKALAKNLEHKKKLERLKELEKLKEEYLRYSKMAEIDTRLSKVNLNRPKDFRRASKRYGFVKPGQSIFLSVRKLDIGTFDPDYTALVLSGINLTGVNIELNPGNAYGAFSWGKAIANFDNPLNFSAYSGGRNIISGRIGVGNKDKFLLAISILKGTDDSGNQVKDSFYDYYLPNYNYVIGFDARYKISANAEAGIEYAKSRNEVIGNETTPGAERLGKLFNPNEAKYSNAFNAFSTVNFNENATRIKFLTRVVDPFYYSFGTPYLRRDNFRIELKGEQLFWKKQLTTGVTYRRDADNIHELKQGTSINNSFIYNMQLRIKKYPYLLLTYSPNYQTFFNSAANKQIKSQVKFYNAILGYTYQSKKIIANTTVSYTKQFNKSNQPEWRSFDVNQYSVFENVNLREVNLTINSGITYTLPLVNADTGKVFGFSLSCTKGIFKNKATISAGGKYLKDFTLEERYVAEAGTGFGLGFGINCQVQLERHFITPYTALSTNKDMFLGRITMIKSF